MPKTAKTRNARKNSNPLTADELKELIELIESMQAGYACLGRYCHSENGDRRYLAMLERIKGKLRRGF